MSPSKPTYEELERRVAALEKQVRDLGSRTEGSMRIGPPDENWWEECNQQAAEARARMDEWFKTPEGEAWAEKVRATLAKAKKAPT